MGKLANALDKAGYGEEDFLSVEDEPFTHEVETEPINHRQVLDQVPEIQYPEETQIEVSASSSMSKIPEHQKINNTENTESTKVVVKPSHSSGAWDERLFKAVNEDPHLPEIFKLLRSRILYPTDGRTVPKSIMVMALSPREGKSFITANLGVTLAQGVDQHSLLIDCDLRRPRLAGLFGINNNRGLVDYLKEQADLDELLIQTSINKLAVLPSGLPPVNPAELLGSRRMHDLIEELSSRYQDRIIVVDSPPGNIASETAVLTGQVDGMILVIRQGGSSKPQIKKFLDSVDRDKILGIVFNGHKSNMLERSLLKGYNYGYYHEDKYT